MITNLESKAMRKAFERNSELLEKYGTFEKYWYHSQAEIFNRQALAGNVAKDLEPPIQAWINEFWNNPELQRQFRSYEHFYFNRMARFYSGPVQHELNNSQMFSGSLTDMPKSATGFTGGVCEFSQGAGDKDRFRLTLYDGTINQHFYWGNLGFDLKTMKLAKESIPILADHDNNKRLGFSDRASFAGKFVLEGPSLRNDLAAAIQKEATAGFPFEASMRFDPVKSKIEYIKDGQTATVNGRTLTGPGALITNAMIMEGSVCTFGALAGCKTELE
jgi:hypothetical protein